MLKKHYLNKEQLINLNKIKVIVFSTVQAWVARVEPEFIFADEKLLYTLAYTYLGVTSQGLGSPRMKLHAPDFLVYMQPLVVSKENVHKSNSKDHELSCIYDTLLISGDQSLIRCIAGKI
jgi:hypothetical protein